MATATKDRSALTMTAGELLAALQDVTRVVSSRGPKPILANVRIGDGLITGTNLEIRIDRQIGEQCEPFLLPADRLVAILRACRNDDTVTLTPSGSTVKIKCGRGSWTLPSEDVAEYPTLEATATEAVCRIPADQFERAIKAVAYATDVASSRYAIGGVYIDVTNSDPTFVGTDGRRLSAVQTETDQAVDDRNHDAEKPGLIVPVAAMLISSTLCDGVEGSVQIEATKSEAVISISGQKSRSNAGVGVVVTARLVDGRFPRWRDVFPERDAKATAVNANELLAATRQAAIVTSEQSRGVVFAITADGIHLTARSSEAGESSVTCPHLEFGQAATVSLDPSFVCDFLRACDDGEPVEIEAVDAQSAVVLRCGDYHGVIMPLAVEG